MINADLEQIRETDLWDLYQQGVNYCLMLGMYSETNKNYRFYNGDQWNGKKLNSISPVQLNIIKPILRYKIGVIHSNLYAINFSSQNFESKVFRKKAEEVCKLLNRKAAKIWEKDNMDIKGRKITKDAGINGEGLIYVNWLDDDISNEIIKKVDVYYGNENDSDIQSQPYIIIKQRRSVLQVKELARKANVSEEEIKLIVGDNDNFYESGDLSKYEKDSMVTLLTKMWKEEGTVRFSQATRYCEIKNNKDSGLTYYPLAHFLWEELEGSSRGEDEVKHIIANQVEINKNMTRSILVAKNTAFPQKIVAVDKIINPQDIDSIGATIKINGGTIDDVSKAVNTLKPTQMSTDVEKIRNELISVTRELAGAGEVVTGQVDPTQASGKAILAVQNAAQQPMTEQLIAFKTFCEDLARIWLDMWITYSKKGMKLEKEETDEITGETTTTIETISIDTLKQIRASVKVDITPNSAYDKFAQESSIENLLSKGLLAINRLAELKAYVSLLDEDSVMNKQKLESYIEKVEEEQKKIMAIQQQASLVQQRVKQFFNGNPNEQADVMLDAENMNNQEEVQ